jgi:AcrR family transcriptional regulator
MERRRTVLNGETELFRFKQVNSRRTAMNLAHALGRNRPRVEGDREIEIFEATLEILGEVGYDRLTMDAVATRAKASKATLYRRWAGKANLVIDALSQTKGPHEFPDTGSLRGDLRAGFCGAGGLTDKSQVATFSGVLTAIMRDPEFAEQFRDRFVAEKSELSRSVWDRARRRGEIREDLDLDLIAPALPGIVLHRVFVMGELPDEDLITRVIDQIILPAAGVDPAQAADTPPHRNPQGNPS